MRRDFYTGEELDAQVASLPDNYEARFRSYAAGVNAWIAQVRADPEQAPRASSRVVNASPPADWTVRDSAAIGVYLARTVPSDDGEELNNCKALDVLRAEALRQGAADPHQGAGPHRARVRGLVPAAARAHAQGRGGGLQALACLPQTGAAAQGGGRGRHARGAAPRRSPDARATRPARVEHVDDAQLGGGASLFNGPQLGFQIPELFVEFEIHRPGYDVRGVTAPGRAARRDRPQRPRGVGLHQRPDRRGRPLRGAADRRRDATSTRARTRQMECRDEVFGYRSPPSTRPAPRPRARRPESGSEKPAALPHASTGRCRRAPTASPSPAATRSGCASSRRSRGWSA